MLKDFPETRIAVRGYTDATGPRALNQRLSHERAEGVVAYLARSVASVTFR